MATRELKSIYNVEYLNSVTYGGSLAAAVATIGATPTILVVTVPNSAVNASLTTPPTLRVVLEGNGSFKVATGQTLTITNLKTPTGEFQLNTGLGKLILTGPTELNLANWAYQSTFVEAVDAVETAIDVLDASVLGAAPFVISAGSNELMLVTGISGNTLTVTRAYRGSVASTHANGAKFIRELSSVMWAGMNESITATGGGVIKVPPGSWPTAGNWDLPSGIVLRGSGSTPDSVLGTNLVLTSNSTSLLKVGNIRRTVTIEDINLDLRSTTSTTALELKGSFPQGSFHVRCSRVMVNGGSYGATCLDADGVGIWQFTGLVFDQCYFLSQNVSCFLSTTSNTKYLFTGCSFTPTPNAVADAVQLYYSGTTKFENCTFNGVSINPQTVHTNISAIETRRTTLNEVLDASETGIDVVNGAAFGAAPFTIVIELEQMNVTSIAGNTFTVVRGVNGSTAITHATGKLVHLSTYGLITTVAAHECPIGEAVPVTIMNTVPANLPGGYIQYEKLVFKAISTTTGYAYVNPKRFNSDEIGARKDFTSAGTGTNQLRTTVPITAGRPRAAIHIRKTLYSLVVENCEDEGFPYSFIIEETYEKLKAITLTGNSFLGKFRITSEAKIISTGNAMYAGFYEDATDGINFAGSAYIWSKGDSIHYEYAGALEDGTYFIDFGNTPQGPNPSVAHNIANSQLFEEANAGLQKTQFRSPIRVRRDSPWLYHETPLSEFIDDRSTLDRPLARWGIGEPGVDEAAEYMSLYYIDAGSTIALTYPITEGMFEWRPRDLVAESKRGFFQNGRLIYRGRRVNVEAAILSSTANVTTFNCSLGERYYFGTLTEDTTLNATNVIDGEFKTVFIPANGTNRLVLFGGSFDAKDPGGFNTGNIAGMWTMTFKSLGSTLYQFGEAMFMPTSGDGVGNTRSARVVSAATQQMVPEINYIVRRTGSRCVLTLPVMCNPGDRIIVNGASTSGWKIAQNAGQTIVWTEGGVPGTNQTTTGVTGYLESQDGLNAVVLECYATDYFKPINCQGVLTII